MQPPAAEPQLSLAAGRRTSSSAAADNAPVSAANPPPQQAGSSALSMLTAALNASPTETGVAAEPAATEPRPAQQQHGGAPDLASAEALPGQWPWDGPSAPNSKSRSPQRRALGSGGRSGDPVLLESFLNAGMHATSVEVRGAPMSPCIPLVGVTEVPPALCLRAGTCISKQKTCAGSRMSDIGAQVMCPITSFQPGYIAMHRRYSQALRRTSCSASLGTALNSTAQPPPFSKVTLSTRSEWSDYSSRARNPTRGCTAMVLELENPQMG